MNELHDNITFFLNEKNNNDDSNNEDEIQRMMDEFTNLIEQDTPRDNQ